MKFFDDLYYKLGLKRLQKGKSPQRRRSFLNYETSMTVGLIYRVKDVDQHDTINQYIKHLKENEGMRDVEALGYWDSKEDIPTFLQARRHFDFFTLKDISKQNEPANDAAREFQNKGFDILIDLTREEDLPLLFVLRDSDARFKVGFPGEHREAFLDMIMDIPEGKSLRESIEQINYYLTILNKQPKAM